MAVTDPDTAFRAEVRAWLQAHLPPDMVARSRSHVHPSRADMLGVTAVLAQRGWSVPHWPEAQGGPGWTARRRQVFEEELVLAGGPSSNIQGVSLVGPVLYTYGTPAQQARHLPGIREGRVFWSQGFSEPNAGSDLASLRTRAVRDGDAYVVNGQKIWTSQAMVADWLFCLVRTDPAAKPQRGISFLLIDLRSPGITVRPITSIDEGESLCEVFFDDVRVPVANLVGEEGKGWDYAKFLLEHERVQTAEVPRNKLYLARLQALAAATERDGRPLAADPVFAQQVATAGIDLLALEAAVQAALDQQDARHDASPLTPSALKVLGCELMQRTLGLQLDALGPHASAYLPHSGHRGDAPLPGPALAEGVVAEFLFRRAATIYGGSSEVQKNIIAKLLFAGDEGPAAALTEDQALLRESARRFAQREAAGAAPALPRDGSVPLAANRAAWQRLAEAGFTALGLPEDAGGGGGSAADLAVVCEALGAGGLALPFVGVTVAAGQALAALDLPAGRRAELVGSQAAAAPLTALAHEEDAHSAPPVATRARATAGGWVLDGAKCMVAGGDVAERFLVSAWVEDAGDSDGAGAAPGPGLFLVDATAPGLHRQPLRTIAGQGACALRLEHVHLPAAARLDTPGTAAVVLARAEDHALVMACADAVGAMAQALWTTRDYLATRQQFGSPLAEFQALRHRLAEMYAELTAARALLARGVAALDGPAGERRRLAAACKARIGRAALFVGGQAVQLHGGMGMTEACGIGRHYKRLLAFEHSGGHHRQHTQRFAALDAAAGPDPT